FLQGSTLEQCYASVAKIADYWLDVLYSKGHNMPDSELFELISENRSMSRKLEDYGEQKSTSISTAKRLAEFLGDQMVKDAGLACKFIISRKPEGAPVTERAIPLAIFQSEVSVRRHYLRRWLKDNTMGDADIRDVLDWNYYIERLGGTIQKIITIPAALQGLNNPVPRVQHPDWLHKKMLEKNDTLKQRRISEMFSVAPPKPPTTTTELTDVEDLISRPSNRGQLPGVPVAHKRRREGSDDCEEHSDSEPVPTVPKTWREALGDPPSPGTSKTELVEWLRFHKRKWRWQISQRDRHHRDVRNSKRIRTAVDESVSAAAPTRAVTLGGFLRKTQRSLIEQSWQIIQIIPVDDLGNFTVWAMVGEELHKIRLSVPRIFYVNQRTPAPPENDGATTSAATKKSMWKKVHRVLPRARPVCHLYQYVVPEQIFRDNRLGLLADLATPDIEGIYETQMTLEFRALMELGCVCAVQRSEARALAALATKDLDSFNIQQLEMRPITATSYLKSSTNGGVNMRKIFVYQHVSPTGRREMWGLFSPANKKALVIVLDTVRTNQLPTVRSLYTSERIALLTGGDENQEKMLPPPDMTFEVYMEIDAKQVYQRVTRALTAYRDEKRGPTILCLQTALGLHKLNQHLPICLEFPEVSIHIADDAALLSGLDWQRHGARSMIRHFLNLNRVLQMMLEQCLYFHPLGNMPPDTVLFGADLFYARLLQRHNFVLWCSSGARPDLGGREADDSRLLAEFEDNISIVQNRAGLYRSVCVELTIESLAVSALLQASKVQELEGTSSAITFDVMPQASLEEMITSGPNGPQLSNYDETALCSQAFRVMRMMVNAWLREVSINRNVFSDFQIIHFYRWVRSSRALLYDPALRRALNTLMRKLFLQIVAEFRRMKAEIIYADFNRIVIDTGKRTVADAISYTDFVVQNIRNRELFHSVSLSFQQAWEFLLWIDPTNYGGVRGNLPKDVIASEEMTISPTQEDAEEEELSLEMNWSISEQLPEERRCRANFESFVKMHDGYARGANGPALEFVKAVTKAFAACKGTEEQLTTMRRNMLLLVGVGDFSDKAVWKESIKSFVLTEVICQACNHCRDLDLCKDTHRALKDGDLPVWLCAQCNVDYDNVEIEMRLLDVVQRKLMSYTLQDLRCVKCKQIKRENLSQYCTCTGNFENLISTGELRRLLQTFHMLAKDYRMHILEETVQHILQT
uniref:DNA polymerase epsilon catalytic subunit n=1 Tax=Anopheles maculatus TaxID=74869 RepID=A0A182SCP7_9DIPT